jgi:hypothetical protein
MLAATKTVETNLVLIIAIVLFCVAGVFSISKHAREMALVSFGLAVFALAFIVNLS